MADLLIIDDDIDAALLLADIVRVGTHEVRIGYDGLQALRLARDRTPDVVFLDVEMPLLDGPRTALEMSRNGMGLDVVSIILVSGCRDLESVARHIGTEYFLAKPYGIRAVEALLARALSERAQSL